MHSQQTTGPNHNDTRLITHSGFVMTFHFLVFLSYA